jgi:heme/copper-type cytochrome/quinol oxidase subunit 1
VTAEAERPSTIGAFILAAGIGVVAIDVLQSKKKQPLAARNPWQAGTLEWVQEMPGEDWGTHDRVNAWAALDVGSDKRRERGRSNA